ncbi:hypothetical protein PG984_007544 [Apiospora sp. TS-2023a]
MVPGWGDKSPNDLRKASREELLKTGLVKIVERRLVVSAAKLEDGTFEVVDDKGDHWKGRKIVLAYGYTDNYGKLIYHCLFCYGYEKRGAEVAGVLATGPLGSVGLAPVFAADASRFAKHVKLYTHGNTELGNGLAKVLAERNMNNMEIDNRKLVRISKTEDDKLRLEFDTGADNILAFMGHGPDCPVDRTLPDQLGCEIDPQAACIKVSENWKATSVDGVFAAGDCCSRYKSALTGMSAGSCAGVGVARHLAGFSMP